MRTTALAGLLLLLELTGSAVAAASAVHQVTGLRRELRNAAKPTAAQCPEGCELENVTPGSCLYDGTSGNMLCVFCKPSTGRVAAADGSCGCQAGQYLASGSCVPCPKGSYCLGGSAAESVVTACGPNLDTINPGSKESKDCVTTPGYRIVPETGLAERCPADTFNNGKNRLTACLPCPAGFTTNGLVGQTSVYGCLLRPGWRGTSLFKAVRCPRGQYRAGYVAYSATVSCDACPEGTNTQFSASTTKDACNLLLPTWRWKDTSKQLQHSEQPAEKCPWHSYCPGGVAGADKDGSTACPNSLWTRSNGAKSLRECLIPLGHYLPSSDGVVTPCPNGISQSALTNPGSYQPRWLSPSDKAAAACLSCGSGVLSQPVTVTGLLPDGVLPPGGGAAVTKVAGPSSSCYIRRGQGLVIDSSATRTTGALAWRAVSCTSNNYGTSKLQRYSLARSPCKDCPFGTVTSASNCNPDKDECPDADTGGYYSIAACRYPAGATCGNIQGSSGGTATYYCASPLKYDLSRADEGIGGLTPAAASDKCCSTVYALDTMCSDKSTELSCAAAGKTLVDANITGLTLSQAVSACCKTTCAGQSCPTGILRDKTTVVPEGETPGSFCCVCTAVTCPGSSIWKTTFEGDPDKPDTDQCCMYPSTATCADGGTSADTTAFSCVPAGGGAATSFTFLKADPESIPLSGIVPSAASSTCCVTRCSSGGDKYTCSSGVLKTPAPEFPGVVELTDAKCCNTCDTINCPDPTAKLAKGSWPTGTPSTDVCCAYGADATCAAPDSNARTVAFACPDPLTTLKANPGGISLKDILLGKAANECCQSGTAAP